MSYPASPASPRSIASRAIAVTSPATIAAWRTRSNGKPRGAGHRFQHDSFKRALAQLAHQQTGEEALFGLRRAAEQIAKYLDAALRRTRPVNLGDGLKRAVEIENFKARFGSGRRGSFLQRAVADADASLPDAPGEERGDGLDFFGLKPPQQVREKSDLFETLARAGNAARSFDHACQQHECGLPVQ